MGGIANVTASRPAARAAPPSPAGKSKQGNKQEAKAGVVDDCAEELQALDAARNKNEARLLKHATEKSTEDPAPAGVGPRNKSREPEETREPSGSTEALAQKKALEDAQLKAAMLRRDNEVLAQRLKKLEAQVGLLLARRRKNKG